MTLGQKVKREVIGKAKDIGKYCVKGIIKASVIKIIFKFEF